MKGLGNFETGLMFNKGTHTIPTGDPPTMFTASFNPLTAKQFPALTTPRFGSNAPPGFAEKKAALQTQLLRLTPEKEGIAHFTLTPETQVPSSVRTQYDAMIETLSPTKLSNFIDRNLLGVAEESADLLCYVGMKAAEKSGALSDSQIKAFTRETIAQLQKTPTLTFDVIEGKARREVQATEGVDKFIPFLPARLRSTEPKLRQGVEDFLTMLLADNAIRTFAQQAGGQFTGPYIQDKLNEEVDEIKENVFNPSYPVKAHAAAAFDRLEKSAKADLSDPANFHTAWNHLVDFANISTDQHTVSLTDLFDYNNLKSNGRVEVFLRNENFEYGPKKLTYKECKQISKPYEKLLEAALLLKNA